MSEQQERMERMQARYSGPESLLCPAGFPVPPGTKEWGVAKGPKGDKGTKGDRGDRGEQGMSARLRYSIVVLFVIAFVLGATDLVWQAHSTAVIGRQQHELSAQAAANARQRCQSIQQTVSIPIPVPLAGNPSRQAWASFEQVERRRGVQDGCKLPPPKYISAGGSK